MVTNYQNGSPIGVGMPFIAHKSNASIRSGEEKEKGSWKEVRLYNGGLSAIFTCPACGVSGDLSDHIINALGEVSPSVVCPEECGFHDFIVLEGWNGINGANLLNMM